MAFIRLYKTSDEVDLLHVFRETATAELKEAGDATLDYGSYNWARPYYMLEPTHCHVIDDGNGTVVGYLLGVPDTEKFVADYVERFLPYAESQGVKKPPTETPGNDSAGDEKDLALLMRRITWQPEEMLRQQCPNLIKQYPAHLHINILPPYQGQGWGRKLVELLSSDLRKMGIGGIHLGKVGTNFEAGKFYAKLGFSRFGEVMDGGDSGEMGRLKDGGIYLVKAL